MLRENIFTKSLLTLLIGGLAGCSISLIIFSYNLYSNDFFEFRLAEALSLLITTILAVFLYKYTSKDSRVIDFLISESNSITNDLTVTHLRRGDGDYNFISEYNLLEGRISRLLSTAIEKGSIEADYQKRVLTSSTLYQESVELELPIGSDKAATNASEMYYSQVRDLINAIKVELL